MFQSDCHLERRRVGRPGHRAPRPRTRSNLLSLSRTFTCVFVTLLASVFGAQRLEAQVRQIDVNGLYPAGARLSSPLTGIAFELPAGFRAEWDAPLGALLALSNDGAFGAVWGWSEGSVEDAAGEVGSRLEQQGIALQVRGEPSLTGSEMRAVFDATSTDGEGVLHALIRQGPRGGVVVVAGMGAAVSEASAARFVDAVANSLEWTEPGAAVWRRQVVGAVLSTDTTTTGASPSSATLSFCSPSQYVYSTSSSSGAEHTGGWWLISDLSGVPLLVLEATDGRTFQWPVQDSGDGFLIDGYVYRVTGQC